MIKRSRIALLGFTVAAIVSGIVVSAPAYADGAAFAASAVGKNLIKKSYADGFYGCYTAMDGSDYLMKDSFEAERRIDSVWGEGSLNFRTPYKNNSKKAVYIPTGLTNLKGNMGNCYNLITGEGTGGLTGTFVDNLGSSMKLPMNDATADELKVYLETLGYKPYYNGESNEERYKFSVDIDFSVTSKDGGTFVIKYKTGNLEIGRYIYSGGKYAYAYWGHVNGNGSEVDAGNYPDDFPMVYPVLNNGDSADFTSPYVCFGEETYDSYTCDANTKFDETPIILSEGNDIKSLQDLENRIKERFEFIKGQVVTLEDWTSHLSGNEYEEVTFTVTNVTFHGFEKFSDSTTSWSFTGTGEALPSYQRIDKATAALKAVTGKSRDDWKTSTEELHLLYQYYLKDIYKAVVYCDGDEMPENLTTINVKWMNQPGVVSDCKMISGPEYSKTTVTGLKNFASNGGAEGLKFHFGEEQDGKAVVDMINTWSGVYSSSYDQAVYGLVDSKTTQENFEKAGTGEDKYTETQTCYTGAGALGWIVCPIIDSGSAAIQGMYKSVIEPFLRTNPKLFEGEGGTYKAWDVFRNIANLTFVIVFLVVIFSQLTGFGIDNYGIKKILPKLIIGAILINLSYIICQLAIDIVNIIGGQIAGLFSSIGSGIRQDAMKNFCAVNTCSTAGGGTEALSAFFIVIIVGAITAAVVLAAGWQVIIPVLLGLLSFIIAALFLFVILGVRQALAVLLVVISPLAFVAYMLPNTKSLFDRWFKTYKALLLAYPICSALVYGGDMVAGIIMSTVATTHMSGISTVAPVLSAGVVSIAPAFLIPTIIRRSMGALGSLSTRLQGGLNRWGRGKSERFMRSTGLGNKGRLSHRMEYREKMAEGRRSAHASEYNNRRAKSQLEKYNKRGGYSKLGAGAQRNYMQALATTNAYDKERKQGFESQLAYSDADQSFDLLSNEMNKTFGENETPDMNLVESSLSRIGQLDEGQFLQGVNCFMNSNGFKKIANMQGVEGQKARAQFTQMLLARKDDPVAKALAKTLNSDANSWHKSFDQIAISDSFGKHLAGLSTSEITSADKDVHSFMAGKGLKGFRSIGKDGKKGDPIQMPQNIAGQDMGASIANILSEEQVAGLMATNSSDSSKAGHAINDVIRASGNSGAFSKLSAEQITNTSKDSVIALKEGSGVSDAEIVEATKAERAKINGSEQLAGKMKIGTAEALWGAPIASGAGGGTGSSSSSSTSSGTGSSDPGAGSFGGGTWDGSFDT